MKVKTRGREGPAGGSRQLHRAADGQVARIGEVQAARMGFEAGFQQRFIQADAGAHLRGVAVDIDQEDGHRADVQVDGVGIPARSRPAWMTGLTLPHRSMRVGCAPRLMASGVEPAWLPRFHSTTIPSPSRSKRKASTLLELGIFPSNVAPASWVTSVRMIISISLGSSQT